MQKNDNLKKAQHEKSTIQDLLTMSTHTNQDTSKDTSQDINKDIS